MERGLRKDPSRAEVMDAVLKSKGMRGMDDLDRAEEEPLLELQQHHEILVVIELCEAARPSKLGSLKGSHAKYEEHYQRMESIFDEVRGQGEVRLKKWEAPPGAASTPSRPQSAQSQYTRLARQAGMAVEQQRVAPRIGAFEVSFSLRNTTSNAKYPTIPLFSKLDSGHWPGSATRLANRIRQELQPFLKTDLGSHSLHAHVSGARPPHPSPSPAFPLTQKEMLSSHGPQPCHARLARRSLSPSPQVQSQIEREK